MLITGSNITTVGHYKDAAERHLHVCAILLKQLDFPQNFRNTNKYRNILAELYYLSGYIVECSINYKYLTSKNFVDTEDYDQRNRWDTNVRIKGHFRFTNTPSEISSKIILQQLSSNNLPQYLQNLGGVSTKPVTGQEAIRENMQRYWDPSVRYAYENTGLLFDTTSTKSVDDIRIYFKAARDLFNALI